MTDKTLIEEVREVLEGITPGEWETLTEHKNRRGLGNWGDTEAVLVRGHPKTEVINWAGFDGSPCREKEANAAFIAAAPTLLRRCLSTIEELQADKAELRAKLDVAQVEAVTDQTKEIEVLKQALEAEREAVRNMQAHRDLILLRSAEFLEATNAALENPDTDLSKAVLGAHSRIKTAVLMTPSEARASLTNDGEEG